MTIDEIKKLVLSRRPPQEPSIAKKASTLGRSLVKWAGVSLQESISLFMIRDYWCAGVVNTGLRMGTSGLASVGFVGVDEANYG